MFAHACLSACELFRYAVCARVFYVCALDSTITHTHAHTGLKRELVDRLFGHGVTDRADTGTGTEKGTSYSNVAWKLPSAATDAAEPTEGSGNTDTSVAVEGTASTDAGVGEGTRETAAAALAAHTKVTERVKSTAKSPKKPALDSQTVVQVLERVALFPPRVQPIASFTHPEPQTD